MTNSEVSVQISPADAAVNPASGKPARATLAALLLLATCFPVLGSVLLSPVLPLISKQFSTVAGVDVLVPLILTVPSLVIGVTAPFAGSVVDRIGRRRLLLAALIAYAILGTAPLYLDSLYAIVATRVGVGIAEAAILTCATTLLTDYFYGKRRNRYLSLSTLITSVAAAIFLAVGGVLGEQGWRTPFWLYGLSILLFVPVLISVWEPRELSKLRLREEKKLAAIPIHFLALPLAVGFVTGIMFFSIIVEMPYVLTGLGVKSSSALGLFSAISSLAAAAGSITFRWVARFGPQRLVSTMLTLAGLGLVLIWIAPDVPVAVVGAVLTSFGTGMLIPTGLTWTVSRLSIDQRGRGVGRGSGVLFFGQFLCPIIVLGISGLTGGLQPALGALGITSVVAAVIFGVLISRREQPDLLRPVN